MSLQDMLHPQEPRPQLNVAGSKDSKAPMRSWRKKYRKLKLRFDKVMEESNQLFLDEHKEIATARRLQEENEYVGNSRPRSSHSSPVHDSQLLDMLLDLNELTQIPEKYELSLPGDVELSLNSRLRTWPTDPSNLQQLSTLLDKIPHTISSTHLPSDMTGDKPPAYLDAAYEEEYLANLDAQLLAVDDESLSHAEYIRPFRPPVSRTLPTEKELSTQNPNSVVSWLRRHHPETFIQEKAEQAHSERSIAKPRGPGKRGSMASATLSTPAPKSDRGGDGAGDEDDASFAADANEKPSGRGKRGARRDDEAYRPKGGSSRGGKRKRATGDEGETPKTGGRGKRAKASAMVAD
jgi:IEC3 subunit of the Ino80 complex, chromatin re-modelling